MHVVRKRYTIHNKYIVKITRLLNQLRVASEKEKKKKRFCDRFKIHNSWTKNFYLSIGFRTVGG